MLFALLGLIADFLSQILFVIVLLILCYDILVKKEEQISELKVRVKALEIQNQRSEDLTVLKDFDIDTEIENTDHGDSTNTGLPVFVAAMAGAILGMILTLLLLAFLNGGTLMFV